MDNGIVKNQGGIVEEWDRKYDDGIAPLPWQTDELGNIYDSLGRKIFISSIVGIKVGFVQSNLDNARLVVDIVNSTANSNILGHDLSNKLSLQTMQNEVVCWADEQFPNRTPGIALLKLFSELGELIDEPDKRSEWADVFILLLDIAHLCNVSADDILRAIVEKMKINRERIWQRQNGITGVISHKKV